MRFVVATRHFSGLGFAVRLKEEGHDVIMATAGTADRRLEAEYALVGTNLVPRTSVEEIIVDPETYRDAAWIWDENHSVEANEVLRRENFRVFGGGRYPDTMEHDREACLSLVGKYGIRPPPSFAFAGVPEALAHLESNSETAFAYKPDSGETFEERRSNVRDVSRDALHGIW